MVKLQASFFMHTDNTNTLVEHFFRYERGRLIATLSKLFGLQQLELAEDIAQEALLDALSNWPVKGIPDNPSAWLYRVAKNKAIDVLKRKSHFGKIINELTKQEHDIEEAVADFFLEDELKDNQLQMLFACCHPSIPEDGQVMFMLKTLCGLSVPEIAKAYLCGDDSVEKRIYRVKEKLREENIQLLVPAAIELLTRLDAVLRVIYLVFNEGYNSSGTEIIIRKDLCNEAMRLCVLLTEMPLTNLPFTHALLALMCYQSSRFDARINEEGNIITLENQDRNKWDKQLIEKGHQHIARAITREIISKYQVEASIAYWYATAPGLNETNWQEIYKLYNLLIQFDGSPVIQLNRCIVMAKISGYKVALDELLQINGLEKNHFYHSTIAEFYKQVNDLQNAGVYFTKALGLVKIEAEKNLLQHKINSMQIPGINS